MIKFKLKSYSIWLTVFCEMKTVIKLYRGRRVEMNESSTPIFWANSSSTDSVLWLPGPSNNNYFQIFQSVSLFRKNMKLWASKTVSEFILFNDIIPITKIKFRWVLRFWHPWNISSIVPIVVTPFKFYFQNKQTRKPYFKIYVDRDSNDKNWIWIGDTKNINRAKYRTEWDNKVQVRFS